MSVFLKLPNNEIGNAQKHNYALDLIRGLAAFAVMTGHVRGFLFVQWSDLIAGSQTHLQFLLFCLTRFAHQSVIVFFVLSGFLVLGRAWNDIQTNAENLIPRYFIARFTRVYLVHLPVVALGSLVALFHLDANSGGFVFSNLFLNLVNLQGIATPGIGGNLALWSLGYEFWYYIIGGALLGVHFVNKRLKTVSVVAATIIVVGISYLCIDWLMYLPIWLAGAAVVLLPRFPTHLSVLCVGLWLTTLGYSMFRSQYHAYALFAFATALNLNWIWRTTWSPSRTLKTVIQTLADLSFSLYVTHYLTLVVLFNFLKHKRWASVGVLEWLVFASVCICLLSFAWVFSLAFESRTQTVRRWIEQKILGSVTNPA